MSRYNTPLRYPGGKQKLTPFIVELIERNELDGCDYAEPYAGGAGVAIELLLSRKAKRIHLNDASRPVYAFWRSILKDTDRFCRRIASASLTIKEWRRQKEIFATLDEVDEFDLGYSMFFLNRCNRSGIATGGVIGGLAQSGNWKIDARFNRSELIRRIEAIASHRSSIKVTNDDAEKFILTRVSKLPPRRLVYLDPPYYRKADRLYQNHYGPADHRRIAEVIQKQLKGPWLVSYDGVPDIIHHYSARRSFLYMLQYNAATAYKGTEAFFFSDCLKLPERSTIKSISQQLERLAIAG